MTLKEKFLPFVDYIDLINDIPDKEECGLRNADKCVEVADEFTIGLLEFIEGTYSYSNIFDYWYLHADTSKTYTKKQLVEIYKEQKGL